MALVTGLPRQDSANTVVITERNESMSTEHLHNQRVSQVAKATNSASLLRSYRIDPSACMSFDTAAAAAGTSSDELLALIDAGSRRHSVFAAITAAAVVTAPTSVLIEEYEEEAELV